MNGSQHTHLLFHDAQFLFHLIQIHVELTALRLMANGSRMEMLHAMAERPMSGQELAQKLNLNSGSVFRDLNSLYNARLLLMESTGGRNCYRTNLPVVRNMMERMLNYLQNQG